MLIDTHAHLVDEKLRNDIAAVLDRAKAAGVERIVCVATSAADSAAGIDIAKQFPQVTATAGIHPNHAAEAQPGDWETVVRLAADPSVVALGETGLDRHWDFTPFAMQEDYFSRHLALSRKTGKPVVIHCREADANVTRMLREEFDQQGPIRGVLHSFCGSWETAEACIAMGLFVSFAGMLTYKTADDVRAVAAKVPADRLMVETDCPYLAPVPHRGKTNEPAFVVHTAQRLAELRGTTLAELSEIATANAKRLFSLEK
jgi:TatD DNase family protein